MIQNILTSLFSIFFGVIIYSQGTYVFLGSFNREKSKEGIYVYELDTLKGRLTKITSVRNVLNPSFLALSPNGKRLYACTESKTKDAGSVSSFDVNLDEKKVVFLNSQKGGGENPVYLTVHKNHKWLINGNFTDGSISVYPLLENGEIDSIVQSVHYLLGSSKMKAQGRSHIHSVVFNSSGDILYSTDLGADSIRSYIFDTLQKTPLNLNQLHNVSTVLGSGPRHFVFHPNGNYAYCIEELSGTISSYIYSNGRLDSLERVLTHNKEFSYYESSDIQISPDGLFLYASNRGEENNIAIYKIQSNGKLIFVDFQSTHGIHPRTFAIDPSGNFLIVTNVVSNRVVLFKRNKDTGLLKKKGKKVFVKNVSIVIMRRYFKEELL